jgi:hypothetical protein
MTPDDRQIDLLIRRYARGAEPRTAGDHLDADEMNTFAEGALPPAAQAQYVSHLAQCDQCRKQVAQLTISSGAMARAEVAETPGRRPFWAGLNALFSPRVLRYAAFTAVLAIAAGITFIALRRPSRPNDMIAAGNQAEQHPSSALQPSASSSNGATAADSNSRPQQSGSPSAVATGSDQFGRRDADRIAEAAPVPTITREAVPAAPEAKKAPAESDVARDQPSYAPPPPGEAGKPASVAGTISQQEQRKTEQYSDKVTAANRGRPAGLAKDARDDSMGVTSSQPTAAARRAAIDEKSKGGPSRNLENTANRNLNGNRAEPMTLNLPAPRNADKEEVQTRSVGGRKFRKQGNAWVDQKFKPSLSVKSIARGSEDFNALDSGLRSIAQQLGGEIIVVWKGKAYLIK